MDLEQEERARKEHPVLWHPHLAQCLERDPGDQVWVTPLHELVTPAWVWDGLLTPAECQAVVTRTDALGYGCTDYDPALRGNLRLIVDDPELAAALWKRVQPLLPPNFAIDHEGRSFRPTNLNSRFRFSKYYPGDRFSRHCDDCVVLTGTASPNKGASRDRRQRSMYTLNIYLNDNSDAATRVYTGRSLVGRKNKAEYVADPKAYTDVAPKAGRALVFQQLPTAQVLHEGLVVTSGCKYLMRTDIMFE